MRSVFPGRMRARRIATVAGVAAGSGFAVIAPGATNSSASARCRPSQVRLAASFYGVATGQFLQTFTFTNTSGRVCRIAGWPSLEIEVGYRRPVPVRTRRVVQGRLRARPFSSVLLRARGSASFDVYGADWDFVRTAPARWPPRLSSRCRGAVHRSGPGQDPELPGRLRGRSGCRRPHRPSVVVVRLAAVEGLPTGCG